MTNPITSETPYKDKIVDVRQSEVEKKQEFIGRITTHKGHTLFEVNLKEHTIEPAEFEDDIAVFKTDKPISKGIGVMQHKDGSKKMVLDALPTVSKKLIKKPDCIYISALNRTNLLKKLVKRGIIKIKKS